MGGPLEGITVVEMGFWVAGPSAAGIMADWGAEVVKIEPPTGDPFRGLFALLLGVPATLNPPFDLDNRGKRGVALNLETDEGRRIAQQLIEGADVFVSNVRPGALQRCGLSYEELRALNPRLVYCHVSGYGADGADRDRAAYDVGAFWSRAGVAASLTAAGHAIPQQRGGMGDHMAGQAAAGAVCAALLARARTGEGQRVTISLLRIGVYMMGWDTNMALRGVPVEPYDRFHALNPIINSFPAGDGRWFWLLLLQAGRHWPDLCRALGRDDLMEDPRFADIPERMQNAEALVRELDRTLATRSLAEWAEIFDHENVWWAPVQSVNEVVNDPVAHNAGAFVDVPGPDGPVRMVSTPADFSGTPWAPRGLAPEFGQHTEEVLLELGYDWEQIVALKGREVIP